MKTMAFLSLAFKTLELMTVRWIAGGKPVLLDSDCLRNAIRELREAAVLFIRLLDLQDLRSFRDTSWRSLIILGIFASLLITTGFPYPVLIYGFVASIEVVVTLLAATSCVASACGSSRRLAAMALIRQWRLIP